MTIPLYSNSTSNQITEDMVSVGPVSNNIKSSTNAPDGLLVRGRTVEVERYMETPSAPCKKSETSAPECLVNAIAPIVPSYNQKYSTSLRRNRNPLGVMA